MMPNLMTNGARRPRRTFVVLLTLLLGLAWITCGSPKKALAQTSQDGLWEYSLDGDGKATITRYLGTDETVVVPPDYTTGTLDGHSVVAIGEEAFKDNDTMVNLWLYSPVETLGTFAFSGCSNLATVHFQGDGITAIPEGCFYKCGLLGAIEIPGNVKTIGYGAFAECGSLASLTFKAGSEVKELSIGGSAFQGCTSLTEVTLPNTLSNLGEQAFRDCTNLEVVTFQNVIDSEYLGASPFFNCQKLHTVVVPAGFNIDRLGIPAEAKIAYLMYDLDQDGYAIITSAYNKDVETVHIPSWVGNHKVVGIGGDAFNGCSKLQEVIWPEECYVQSIEDEAFVDCAALTSITIPSSITSLGIDCFQRCIALEQVNFETTSLKVLSEELFDYCVALKEITVPDGVETIVQHCFHKCTSLETVKLPSTVTSVGQYAFASCTKLHDVYMPDCPGELSVFETAFNGVEEAQLTFHVYWGSGSWVWFECTRDFYGVTHAKMPDSTLVFEAVDLNDESVSVEVQGEYTYCMEDIWPSANVVVKRYGHQLGHGSEYVVSEQEGACINAGEATASITSWFLGAYGAFKGSRDFTFTIKPASLSDATTLDDASDCMWDGQAWEPSAFRHTFGSSKVYEFNPSEYEVEYSNNVEAGRATVKMTMKEGKNFKGSKEFHFDIRKRDLATEGTCDAIPDQLWTGEAITFDPNDVVVYLPTRDPDTAPLTLGAERGDFTISYENNTDLSTTDSPAYVVLNADAEGCNENLTGTLRIPFNIVSADIGKATVEAIPDQEYDGTAKTPELKVKLDGQPLELGTDYSAAWESNTEPGAAKVTLTGIGPKYAGTLKLGFTITPRAVTITAEGKTITYGDPKPELTATVDRELAGEPVRYTLSRKLGDDAGSYAITVTPEAGQAHYDITCVGATFEIKPADISEAAMTGLVDVTYDGSPWKPEPTVTWKGRTLAEGTDYELSYGNNTDASTATEKATVTAAGRGNFAGSSLTGNFEIARLDIGACDVAMPYQIHQQDGSALEPSPRSVTAPGRDGTTLTLAEGRDYEVTGWRDNVDAGTGYATIEGRGNLAGKREDPFNILSGGDLSQGYVLPEAIEDQTYTGGHIEPAAHPYLKDEDAYLLPGVGYEVEYVDNVDVGEATVRFTGIDPLYGTLEATFRIVPASIADAVVTAEGRTYDGTAQEPEPTVTWHEMPLTEGKDYEIVGYTDNLHKGTATVTVRGKGNFDDDTTASGTFEIKQRELTIVAGSAKREYDGTALTCGDFSSEGLAAGDEVTAMVDGSITDVGETSNVASGASVTNADGDGVDDDYEISYRSGTLTVLPYSPLVTVGIAGHTASALYDGTEHVASGYDVQISDPLYKEADFEHVGEARVAGTDAGTYPMGLAAGQFANANGNFSNVAFEVTDGSLEVTKRSVTLTSASAEKVYDGTPLTAGTVEVGGDAWASDEGAIVNFTGSQLVAGTSENAFSYELKSNTKGSNYDVTTSFGTLKVTPAGLSDASRFSVAALADEVYDGEPHEPVPVVTDSATGAALAKGTDFTLAYRDNVAVGTATVTVTGTGNYAGSVDVTFRIVAKTARYELVSAPSEVVADGRTAPEFAFRLVGDDAHTFDHFTGVKVDGKALDKAEYDARRGSVVISLKPAYVKTLSAGKHTLTAVFDDGEASATFTVTKKADPVNPDDPKPKPMPQTSDTAIPLPVVLGVAAAGVAAVVAGIFLRRRK